ncbi:hypothetical protein BDN70DRAFT_928035 [Pholiota conissans]|uniref:Uncharacterized protein n=1 Tax=Pholiota conissans TaxID=109636 RepID=A0A9P5ZAS5_9AGAR|nr:hypothetical protein BDN70DRAFT_928035 [Pholiota conissans]
MSPFCTNNPGRTIYNATTTPAQKNKPPGNQQVSNSAPTSAIFSTFPSSSKDSTTPEAQAMGISFPIHKTTRIDTGKTKPATRNSPNWTGFTGHVQVPTYHLMDCVELTKNIIPNPSPDSARWTRSAQREGYGSVDDHPESFEDAYPWPQVKGSSFFKYVSTGTPGRAPSSQSGWPSSTCEMNSMGPSLPLFMDKGNKRQE